jgi:hypothetical protein
MIPNFIVAGAAKAGTTSVYNCLSAHPQVYMSPMKEPYFFSFIDASPRFTGPHDEKTNTEGIITSMADYERLFDGAVDYKAIGESSNSYMYHPHAAANIKKHIPHCKIIILLRHPVERAYSHYRQSVVIGHEDLSFEEAFAAEEERLKAGWRWHYQYRGQSLYFERVRDFLGLFGKENVRIYRFESLAESPHKLMADIYGLIGVDPAFTDYPVRVDNPTALPRSRHLKQFIHGDSTAKEAIKLFVPRHLRASIVAFMNRLNTGRRFHPVMKEATRKALTEYFAKDVRALQDLLKMDLSSWLETKKEETCR